MTVKISCRVILCRALPFGAMASLGSASLHAVGGILARSAAVRRGTRAVRASTYSTSVGPSADAKDYRVLAFEDAYSIKDMLADAKVRYGHFEQRWDSEACIDAIKEFGRVDVLMLDFYLPPLTGLQVLMKLNEAVEAGVIERAKAHLRDVVGGVVQQQAGAGGRGRRVRQVGRRHVGRMGAGRVVTRTSIVTVAQWWYSSGSC